MIRDGPAEQRQVSRVANYCVWKAGSTSRTEMKTPDTLAGVQSDIRPRQDTDYRRVKDGSIEWWCPLGWAHVESTSEFARSCHQTLPMYRNGRGRAK